MYVGSTKNFENRQYQHRSKLVAGIHPSKRLQAEWDHLGSGCFEFRVIEECEVKRLIERERFHSQRLNSCEVGYNEMRPSGIDGFCHSDDTKKRVADGLARFRSTDAGIFLLESQRRATKQHEYNGEWKTSKEWAKELGVNFTSFRQRLAKGMPVEEAVKVKTKARYKFRGEMLQLKQIAKITGINYGCLWSRVMSLGLSLEDALAGKTKRPTRNKYAPIF